MCHKHQFPCLHCHPHDYIRMVQHMIESCLVFQMSKDESVEALAKHANIEPVITLTVWEELLKENKAFFQEYFQALSPRQSSVD
ncbi:transmembrane protein [Gossypium australe]|uniref:Transmembrane protein n=1 Tax=Gossypium australe TaxID=47621 RepID=A0A5B6UIA0_9ROSI|nr:transmembrane protein [Gossypium australe]